MDLTVRLFNDIVGADGVQCLLEKSQQISTSSTLFSTFLAPPCQFHGMKFFFHHSFELLTGCFLAPLGVNRFEHFGYQLNLREV